MVKKETKKQLKKDCSKFIPIAYDIVFKNVFGNEQYPNNTAYLASVLLDIPYEEIKGRIKFRTPRNDRIRANDKKSEKDVVFLLNLSENYKINIEVNMANSGSGIQTIIERNYYYAANLFGGGLQEGEEYTKIRTTIQYNLNNFNLDKKKPQIERNFTMKDESGVLSSKLEIVHLNIAEMHDIWYNQGVEEYDQRMRKLIGVGALIMTTDKKKFKNNLKQLEAPADIKESIERIVEEMNEDDELNIRYYNRDEEKDRLMRSIIDEEVTRAKKLAQQEAKEMIEESIEERSKEVREEGREEGQRTILQNLLSTGMTLEEIANATKLSEEEINSILKR